VYTLYILFISTVLEYKQLYRDEKCQCMCLVSNNMSWISQRHIKSFNCKHSLRTDHPKVLEIKRKLVTEVSIWMQHQQQKRMSFKGLREEVEKGSASVLNRKAEMGGNRDRVRDGEYCGYVVRRVEYWTRVDQQLPPWSNIDSGRSSCLCGSRGMEISVSWIGDSLAVATVSTYLQYLQNPRRVIILLTKSLPLYLSKNKW